MTALDPALAGRLRATMNFAAANVDLDEHARKIAEDVARARANPIVRRGPDPVLLAGVVELLMDEARQAAMRTS